MLGHFADKVLNFTDHYIFWSVNCGPVSEVWLMLKIPAHVLAHILYGSGTKFEMFRLLVNIVLGRPENPCKKSLGLQGCGCSILTMYQPRECLFGQHTVVTGVFNYLLLARRPTCLRLLGMFTMRQKLTIT